jgi:hypothetical protein
LAPSTWLPFGLSGRVRHRSERHFPEERASDLIGLDIGFMPIPFIYFHDESDYLPPIESRTSRPTGWMEIPMKNLLLAAFAALSLTAAIVPAANARSTIAGDAQATRLQQSGAYGAGG